jgi:hypothetical protein
MFIAPYTRIAIWLVQTCFVLQLGLDIVRIQGKPLQQYILYKFQLARNLLTLNDILGQAIN